MKAKSNKNVVHNPYPKKPGAAPAKAPKNVPLSHAMPGIGKNGNGPSSMAAALRLSKNMTRNMKRKGLR